MKRTDMEIIILVIISTILLTTLSSSFASGLNTVNIGLSSSGTMQYPVPQDAPIKKVVYAYGGTLASSGTSFAANNFDLLDLEYGGSWFYPQSLLQSIKSQNPSIRILGYQLMTGEYTYSDDWSIVNSHEDWFVHDINGNRVRDTGAGWYLMDVGSTGWRQHWVANVNSKLATYPQYDGVFLDNAFNNIPTWITYNVPYSSFKSDTLANWHTNGIGFLQYAKMYVASGKILVINSDSWTSLDYVNAVDGMMVEGFAHATWEDPSSHTSFSRQMLDIMSQASATGKITWYTSGTTIPSGTSAATVNAIVKFSFAAALLSTNGPNTYFGFNDWTSPDGSRGYYPIMDTAIGQAINAYYSSQNVLMRDFTGGKTLLNPSGSSYTISLGHNYRLSDGTVVSTITLSAWSGEILFS